MRSPRENPKGYDNNSPIQFADLLKGKLLLIHGMADTHVPAWHSQLVYRFVHDPDEPERSDLWLVPGAGHLEALEVAPEAYVQRTLDWFDEWLG
jgi:dipeptidyl aminopeptidase/acylaminoacyl peptidase